MDLNDLITDLHLKWQSLADQCEARAFKGATLQEQLTAAQLFEIAERQVDKYLMLKRSI